MGPYMTLIEDRAGVAGDAEAIVRSRRDPQAFALVFDRHWPRIHAFCTARAGAAGEDLAAEVFRIAFDRRDPYDPAVRGAGPGLYGVAAPLPRPPLPPPGRGGAAVAQNAPP